MIAYKFLSAGRTGRFSGFEWPEPRVWVRAGGETVTCRRGIHACRTQDLPWWLADELWEIELDEPITTDEHKLVAPAGRLLSRIERWNASSAQQYGEACAWRTRDTVVGNLRRAGHEPVADQLASSATLDDLLATARQLAQTIPEGRVSVTIAGDGAFRALTAAPPTSAYIAAQAALRFDGPQGYAAERRWQSSWLVERLGLRTDL